MREKAVSAQCGMGVPESDDLLKKAKHARVSLRQTPIHPGVLVIVAVRIVIAFLRAADLVSHQDHRNALAHHEDRHCILHLASAQFVHRRVGAFTFPSTVPTVVVVPAVVVVLAVGFIVLTVEGNKILERKTIVTSDEVCTGGGTSVPVKIRGTLKSSCHLLEHALFAFD